jgi:hypothetical protein
MQRNDGSSLKIIIKFEEADKTKPGKIIFDAGFCKDIRQLFIR